jgi:hypothetical protein
MGDLFPCTMPCCQEKSDSCHAKKEWILKADGCCGETTSFALGSACGPERKDAIQLSIVSYSPTPFPNNVKMPVLEVPATSYQDHTSTMAATAPPGKAPLYLQNLILLI